MATLGSFRGRAWGRVVIPITPQPEPSDFGSKVRRRGEDFLQVDPHPVNWKNREYWRDCIPELRTAYGAVCAYCAHWIPKDTGTSTVDHFIPKSEAPDQAYEWANFRLASLRMNARKGTSRDVLDPFDLEADTFILEFPSLMIKPNPNLPLRLTGQVKASISRLKLNETVCLDSRLGWLKEYYDGELGIGWLRRRAPFIAYEIQRQGLSVEKLKHTFRGLP